MLIGITGSICSGKHTTAEYLVQHHGFLRLHLPTPSQLQHVVVNNSYAPSSCPTTGDESKSNGTIPGGEPLLAHLLPSVTDQKGTRGLTFPDVDGLLEFVTKRWREHWVLTDIYDENTLELLLRRPFFLLLNVEAPVGVRYQRFSERYVHIPFVFLQNKCLANELTSTSLPRTHISPQQLNNHPCRPPWAALQSVCLQQH